MIPSVALARRIFECAAHFVAELFDALFLDTLTEETVVERGAVVPCAAPGSYKVLAATPACSTGASRAIRQQTLLQVSAVLTALFDACYLAIRAARFAGRNVSCGPCAREQIAWGTRLVRAASVVHTLTPLFIGACVAKAAEVARTISVRVTRKDAIRYVCFTSTTQGKKREHT
jgi:hypothetical protein